jgi:DNA-binding NtrC family response regulator
VSAGLPVLFVIPLSDSFSELWPKLARSVNAELRVVHPASPLDGDPEACVLVAAGGVEGEALSTLGMLIARGQGPVIVVGADTGHRRAISLLHAGAVDYFALPADLGALRGWLVRWAEHKREREMAQVLAKAEREHYDFSRLIGESNAFRDALHTASKLIPRGSATVLITGETGTGKELFAQAIHYNGPRGAFPFVEVNCAALPPNLLEAELFGYERGAFTDAKSAKPGLLEVAEGGTLFLDEIGDLPRDLQGKLLRILSEKRVRRLGSIRDLDVNVRIVAATHVDLAARVREGAFREDLFYRLNVLPIHLPPLRERGRDSLLLANHFLRQFSREYEIPCAPPGAGVQHAILAHSWPGNIRELRNAVERALLMGDGSLQATHLLPGQQAPAVGRNDTLLPFPAPLDRIARAAARAMVEQFNGNKSQAARALGIGRRHLYTLLAPEGDLAAGDR